MATTTKQQRRKPVQKEILAAFEQLSEDEQIELMGQLRDRIPELNGSFKLSEAQKKDLARRVAKYRAGKAVMIPWEDVKAEIQAKLKSMRSASKKRRKRK